MGGYGGNEKMVFKKKLLVELELDSGDILNGYLFLGQTQRLSDLMNDDRTFLPFEALDGSITIFTKGMARRVKPVEKQQAAATDSGVDPYSLLGVASNATDAQLREAYHRKVQETHPDKLSNVGVSAEIVKFAHERMARINEAYNKIRIQRRSAAASQAANGHAAQ
jgi:DnaJ like chaperone protein